MEEAVGTGADGLVAIDATRADDADGRLLFLHHACLHAGGVGTQDDVGVCLDEEGVLHIASRMVVGEVHGAIDVPVVLHLGTFGEGEAEAREDIDDLVLDDGQGMARAKRDGVSGTREVEVVGNSLLSASCGLELVDALGGVVLEFVDVAPHLFLHVVGDGTELIHQRADFTFLTQILDAQCLHLLGCSS